MKSIALLLPAIIFSCTLFGQRTVKIRNLWARPQVHVMFQGYTLSFSVKDIDKALSLLAGTGDSTYGIASGLDTAKDFALELYDGTRTQYRTGLQPLMQQCAGTFLLLAGHAYITNSRHKALTEITADITEVRSETGEAFVNFYDPKNNKLIFSGKMPVELYNQDLGIE